MFLIFDCDGVVIDSALLHTKAEAECFSKLGIHITQEDLDKRFAGIPDADVFAALEEETGITIPVDLAIKMNSYKKELFEKELKPIDGIIELFKKGELWDIPRCIASSSSLDMLHHSLKITSCYDLFAPNIYSADMVKRGKPAPDLFLYATQNRQSPENCIVIEDAASGIKAAKAANMTAFGFTGGSHSSLDHETRLLEAGADLVFSDMYDLPNLLRDIENNESHKQQA